MDLDRAMARLRELNMPVPLPARLPTEDEVTAAEQRLGRPLPQDYRQYLLRASDIAFGTLEPCVVTPEAGSLDLVDTAHRAWLVGVPDDLLPICEDNGDYFCLDPRGAVRFWDHNGPTSESWSDLATWIWEAWITEHS